MRKSLVIAAALVMCFGVAANATVNNGGSLALTGEVEGSITITFAEIATTGIVFVTGAGSSSATAAIGTVSMYGTAAGAINPVNFVKANNSGNFTLTGTYKVQVDKANLTSASCDIKAALNASDTKNTWAINTVTLSTTAATTDATAAYGDPYTETLVITVPNSAAAGAFDNSIVYTVVAA